MFAIGINISKQACWSLVNCVINQRLLQAVPHMQQTLSKLIKVINSGLIVIHTLLKEKQNM